MTTFIIRRVFSAAITLFLITLISFIVIQLPPGDVVSNWVRQQEASTGQPLPPETIENLRRTYGFDEPIIIQYFKWIDGFPRGDFGFSIEYSNAPVADILAQRTGLTVFLGVATLFISWGLAIPFGIFAATRKNSRWDYFLSTLSFIGISTPDFLIAVIYLFIAVFVLKTDYAGGLFSQEFKDAPWTWERLLDFAKHLPVPLAILGLGGMAGTFRIMRANLLDILDQQFIEAARAKGLRERIVIYKHATRIAVNPLISRVGMQLPLLISGTIIISIVLDLPTLGPPFIRALNRQDMFLAGTVLMILAIFLLIGNLIADIVLAWSDPRIQYE
ncbi:MAG: ABC transporter permease [Chloroflexota bacterium]|nr:ABC transporter permease [Chloroflexota bacterium]MDE2949257.1 ABC transporter permease [Chloroflexota bacterium]